MLKKRTIFLLTALLVGVAMLWLPELASAQRRSAPSQPSRSSASRPSTAKRTTSTTSRSHTTRSSSVNRGHYGSVRQSSAHRSYSHATPSRTAPSTSAPSQVYSPGIQSTLEKPRQEVGTLPAAPTPAQERRQDRRETVREERAPEQRQELRQETREERQDIQQSRWDDRMDFREDVWDDISDDRLYVGARFGYLPPTYTTVSYGGTSYYYYDGVYLVAYYDNGEVVYVMAEPPVGAIVYQLPAGSTTTVVRGTTYHVCRNTFYQPMTYEGRAAFRVVRKP